LWYRRYLLNRAKLRTAVEVERMEKEKVLELDHMKSRFFANISHEFRTPLTLILGPIDELFERKPKRAELTWDIMVIIRRNARRLQKLINQMLDLSRLETGAVKLHVSEGDLKEFIKTIILSFISLAESKQIRYEYNLPEIGQKLWFDNDKVEKILTNLLSNAFKFTPANGIINVSLQYLSLSESESSQLAEIKVSDTGKGIPRDKLGSIFDRFYQVSDSDTSQEGGTGIGLALTKELVDLYRGEIYVESEVDKGTIFTVKLPVSKDLFREEEIIILTSEDTVSEKVVESDIDIKESEDDETCESHIKKALKDAPVVLIVEDNIDLRNYISRNLGSSYQIMVAENGREGLKSAIDYIPDLVISDLMMPEMDGMEMCRQLKTDERTNHIPVIMLTARADRGSKLEGLETGADDYIIKPFDAKELKVRVRNLIEQRKRMRDKFREEFISDPVNMEIAYEDQFLNKLTVIQNKYISDPDFRIDILEGELHMSRSQVFRKISALTGYTPNDLMRNLRLKKAASLFRSGHKHVAQIMHQVGFNSQSYFGKCFHELYGMTPTEYIHSKGHK
jgi:DNA-binding response OmpR family regulator/nitrogen-specific signal transduction histidine kinase